jgi:hypothetical protein
VFELREEYHPRMKTAIFNASIDVDALVDNGLFVGDGTDGPALTGGGGRIVFRAEKAGNLMKLAAALQEAAIALKVRNTKGTTEREHLDLNPPEGPDRY